LSEQETNITLRSTYVSFGASVAPPKLKPLGWLGAPKGLLVDELLEPPKLKPANFDLGSASVFVSAALRAVAAGGKEKPLVPDLLAVVSSFGVKPPLGVVVEDELVLELVDDPKLKPANFEGGPGGAGTETTGAAIVGRGAAVCAGVGEGDLAESYSFCTPTRNDLYCSRRPAISANGSPSTVLLIAVIREILSPRRDL
jgi:hypothetical protein